MTYAQVNDAIRNATREAPGWPRWLQSAVGMLVTWQDRVAQRRHLSSLDDRLLSDIGQTRSDVDWESAKPFWRA